MKRYRNSVIALIFLLGLYLYNKELGVQASTISINATKEMLLVIPPIFVLMGLLDVFIPKEIMIKYLGENSGVLGKILALVLGSVAAGPLYGAFPVAVVFLKKEVKFSNIMIFIGAWSTTKIPMFLFEMTTLGIKFATLRLLINIPGILIMAGLISKLISKEEKDKIYENAQNL